MSTGTILPDRQECPVCEGQGSWPDYEARAIVTCSACDGHGTIAAGIAGLIDLPPATARCAGCHKGLYAGQLCIPIDRDDDGVGRVVAHVYCVAGRCDRCGEIVLGNPPARHQLCEVA